MNPIAWLDESLSLRLVLTLLHFLWQGAAIGAVAVGCEQVLRRSSAQVRYLLHMAALLLMLICLPATFSWMDVPAHDRQRQVAVQRLPAPGSVPGSGGSGYEAGRLRELTSVTSVEESSAVVITASETNDRIGEPREKIVVQPIGHPRPVVAAGAPVAVSGAASQERPALLELLAPYLTIVYFMCVLGMLGRVATGVWGSRQLGAASVAVTDVGLCALIRRQAARIGLRKVPVVAYCERISVPVVVGTLRPIILVPFVLISGLSPGQLEAILAHELAHLRRYDPLANLAQRIVESILFFHPAVWYVSRRVDIERENATDDLVLAAGWPGVHYADALVRMAELSVALRRDRNATAPAAALAASGGSPQEFRNRILRLLDREASPFRLTRSGLATVLVIAAIALAAPFLADVATQDQAVAADSDEQKTGNEDSSGRQIDDFRLQDFQGKQYALQDFAQHDVLVVAFLGTECPLAKLYGPRLADLHKTYQGRGVAFLGINSNQQDSLAELGHYVRQHRISFPMLKDPGNRVADAFRAERTPEVFVLDRQRRVRYRGQIDDQFGVGYARPEAKEHYLANALDALLAARPVTTARTEPRGCHIGRVTQITAKGTITYANQISRIFQQRCLECHRPGGIAPFAIDSYETAAAWAETIREVVEQERMPPWHANPQYGHFSNDSRMTPQEKELLFQWVENGTPEGNPDDLPPEREFVDGWSLGAPDVVLTMAEPVVVPSTGVVDYQYVMIDPGFAEGKWIRASEIRPGVRSVVHHIIVFIDPPGGDPILEERGVGFETVGGYVPGSPPMELKEGIARYVPAGSKFVFQIHYTPDGTERKDQSQIGLYFADPAEVRYTMQTGVAANLDFEIPPGAADHRVEAVHRFSQAMQIHSLAPHMHYRGKSFRFEATYPNGSREILLDIPRYDFNWQNVYRLTQPKLMPEGSLLRCVAYFDNSAENLSNPDPSIGVRWGEQTWEEMMIGYFEGVFVNQNLSLREPQLTVTDEGKYRARFAYHPDRSVNRVNVAGTFNEWNTSSHPLTDPDGDGVYTADVILSPGAYRYKFVVDEKYWTHDPASRILTGFLHESFFVAGSEHAVEGRK